MLFYFFFSDPMDLQQEVLELVHTNRRLMGEKTELNHHLTLTEDSNAVLRERCHQYHTDILV